MKYLFLILSVCLLVSCNYNTKIEKQKISEKDLSEPMLRANSHMVRNEENQIEAFIKRYNLPMTKTGTGLRYYVYKPGRGKKAGNEMIVKINYSVKLISGQQIYTSENEGPLVFQLGKGGTINGLEEAIMMFRVGDQAKIIVPSHLAFGLLGDQKKIPQRATLVYDISILELN